MSEHPPPPNPFKLGVPIPSLLWESVEEALRVNMRLLAKDIATVLTVPEAPLLESLRIESIRPYIFEEVADKEQDMRCDFYCQRPDAPSVLQRCQQPVFWTPNPTHHRCTEHMYITANPRPTGLPRWHALELSDSLLEEEGGQHSTTLFRTEENLIVDGGGASRGRYNPDRKQAILFTVESDE